MMDPGDAPEAGPSSPPLIPNLPIRTVIGRFFNRTRSPTPAGAPAPRRGRGDRKPSDRFLPFLPSPLRQSMMASAPSSPERHITDPNDPPRRSSDELSRGRRRASSVSSPRSPSLEDGPSTEHGFKKHKNAMAAMMSGLFPKSFSRGREPSRGRSTVRRSSADPQTTSSPRRPSRSLSPNTLAVQKILQDLHIEDNTEEGRLARSREASREASRNKSNQSPSKASSSRLPDYVKPTTEESGERLAKDLFDSDKNLIESSDEDDDDDEESSSEEENIPGVQVVTWGGRKKKATDITSLSPSDFRSQITEGRQPRPNRNPISTGGKKPLKSALKSPVRPQTNFDIPTPATQSTAGTPYGSDDEENREDVHNAMSLSMSVSTIDNSIPNRSIRTIIRGDYQKVHDTIQAEAESGTRKKRIRKYLVAMDLSAESQNALEWAIGTVFRDGDTMYVIHAIPKDGATSTVKSGEGTRAMKEATTTVGNQTTEATLNPGRNFLGRLGQSSTVTRASSPNAEAERVSAVEDISRWCFNFLRRSTLQVRIAIEVIHCSTQPRLLITEAVDALEPTLLVVGARGQSALKGVLLGSFSNYMIHQSSVPVFVARRKLHRSTSRGSKNQDRRARLANYLIAPKSLTQAKVD